MVKLLIPIACVVALSACAGPDMLSASTASDPAVAWGGTPSSAPDTTTLGAGPRSTAVPVMLRTRRPGSLLDPVDGADVP